MVASDTAPGVGTGSKESEVFAAPVIAAAASQRFFQHRLPVLGPGIDREVRLDAQVHAVLPEDLRAKAVEGINVCSTFETGYEGGHASRHLVRRLVGERQGEDAKSLITGRIQQTGNSACEDSCLSGARSGEHEQRALVPIDGSPLNVGQLGQRRLQWIVHYVSPGSCSIALRNASGARCARSGSSRRSAASNAA